MRRAGRLVGIATLLAALGLAQSGGLRPPVAQAAGGRTYYVALGGTGSCTTGQSRTTALGSVGAALGCAAADGTTAANPDAISVAAGTYHERLLNIKAHVNLVGDGAPTILDGDNKGYVVEVEENFTVGMRSLTIQHGNIGGVRNFGTLTLVHTTVTNNRGHIGGGIISTIGTLTLVQSTVSNNTAPPSELSPFRGGDGGGIAINGGTVTLIESTVTNNTANDKGGGIYNHSTTNGLTLRNSTVSNNTARGNGGGINNEFGAARLDHSTVRSNTANSNGGGIFTFHGSLTLDNSTVTGNNAATGRGGGINSDRSTATLVSTSVTNNMPDNCFQVGC